LEAVWNLAELHYYSVEVLEEEILIEFCEMVL
jgi:hypothetical protein